MCRMGGSLVCRNCMPVAIDSAILAALRSSMAIFLRWIMPFGPCRKSYRLPNWDEKALLRRYHFLRM